MTLEVGANSYISVADANKYFETRLHSDEWSNASELEQRNALVTATSKIDMQRLIGKKAKKDQVLAFPRQLYVNGHWHVQDKVPKEVLYATCEEAIALLRQNTVYQDLKEAGIQSKTTGDASVTFAARAMGKVDESMSPRAKVLLRGFSAGTVKIK